MSERDKTETIDALTTLHTRILDAHAGFERMIEKADPDFQATAIRFRDLHQTHAAKVSDLIRAHGGTPDEDGSFMSHVNRAVVSVRSMFDDIDADLMTQIRDGEEHVLDAFATAIDADSHADHARQLRDMREELLQLLNVARQGT